MNDDGSNTPKAPRKTQAWKIEQLARGANTSLPIAEGIMDRLKGVRDANLSAMIFAFEGADGTGELLTEYDVAVTALRDAQTKRSMAIGKIAEAVRERFPQ